MPSCFAPGCSSGYPATRRQNKLLGIKNPSFFRVPKDVALFEEWKKIIPRTDRVLSQSDTICELHFTEDCIENAFVTNLFDGTVSIIERRRKKLKNGSLPTIYPDLPEYSSFLSSYVSKKKSLSVCVVPSEEKQKIEVSVVDQNQVNEDHVETQVDEDQVKKLMIEDQVPNELNEHQVENQVNEDQVENKVNENQVNEDEVENQVNEDHVETQVDEDQVKKQMIEEVSNQLNVYQVENQVNKYQVENKMFETQVIEDEVENQVKEEQVETFTYMHLLQQLKKVQKPNLWWTIASCKEYVICSKWDKFFNDEKKVVVCKDLTTKVFFKNTEVPSLSITVDNIESLSSLLLEIDGLTDYQELNLGGK